MSASTQMVPSIGANGAMANAMVKLLVEWACLAMCTTVILLLVKSKGKVPGHMLKAARNIQVSGMATRGTARVFCTTATGRRCMRVPSSTAIIMARAACTTSMAKPSTMASGIETSEKGSAPL